MLLCFSFPSSVLQEVYSMAVFPFPQLAELREKYTYNITPFPTSVKSNGRFVLHLKNIYSAVEFHSSRKIQDPTR